MTDDIQRELTHPTPPEVPVPEMRNMPDIFPHRGDQVEAWLKYRRDQFFEPHLGYTLMDNLLDEWRICSDTGMSLEEHVNGRADYTDVVRAKKPKKEVL